MTPPPSAPETGFQCAQGGGVDPPPERTGNDAGMFFRRAGNQYEKIPPPEPSWAPPNMIIHTLDMHGTRDADMVDMIAHGKSINSHTHIHTHTHVVHMMQP